MSNPVFDFSVPSGLGPAPEVRGSVHFAPGRRAIAQVMLRTGAADVTFYPTAEALDELAEGLRLLAGEFREAQAPKAAA